jgi:hypothetical protein
MRENLMMDFLFNKVYNMNELDSLFDRGRQAQRKTIEGILEFAQCVKELRDRCGDSTRTDFTKLAKEEWGLSSIRASEWLKIGHKIKFDLITSLPTSVSTLAELATLSEEQFKALSPTPSTTRMDVVNFKMGLLAPPQISVVETKEIEVVRTIVKEAEADIKLKQQIRELQNSIDKKLIAQKKATGDVWKAGHDSLVEQRDKIQAEFNKLRSEKHKVDMELIKLSGELSDKQYASISITNGVDIKSAKIDMTRLENQISAARKEKEELEKSIQKMKQPTTLSSIKQQMIGKLKELNPIDEQEQNYLTLILNVIGE